MTSLIDTPAGTPSSEASDRPASAGPPAPTVMWLRRLWPVPAALVVVATIGLIPDWGSSGPAPGEAFVSVDGSARVERVDGTIDVLVGGAGRARAAEATLRQGDAFDLLSGRAELELSGSVRMEARAGTDLVMGRTPDVRAGDLLVTGEEPTSIGSGGTRVRFDGSEGAPVAGRLVRTAGLWVGVYRGTAVVDTAGTTESVAALRRVDVPAIGEVTGVRPLRYDADDGWDRRYLADAIMLDSRLASVLPGLVESARTEVGGAEALASVLGDLDGMPAGRELARLVDPDRRLEDVLVGATISSLARGGSYADRWRAVFRFRDAGAPWGLVALDRGVTAKAVLAALTDVVEETPLEFEEDSGAGSPDGSGAGSAGDPTTTTTTSGRGGGGGSGDGGGDDGGGGGGGVTPTLPPVPTVPTTPTLPTIPPTTDAVDGILDGLGNTVDDVADGLGDTVDDVLDPDDEPDCLVGVLCG